MKPKLEVIMMFLRKKAKKKSPFICRMDNSLGEWKDDDGKVLQAFLESPTGKKLFDKILRDIVGFTLSPNIALTKEKDAFRRGMIATVGYFESLARNEVEEIPDIYKLESEKWD